MSTPPPAPLPSGERPLAYNDIRRFLVLCLGLVAAIFFIREAGKVLMLFVVAFFLATLLNPLVVWLERRMKRGLAVVLVMLALIAFIVGMGFLLIPLLLQQVELIRQSSGGYITNIEDQVQVLVERYPQIRSVLPADLRDFHNSRELEKALAPFFQTFLKDRGTGIGNRILDLALSMLTGVLMTVLTLLLTTFTLLHPRPLVASFLSVVPERYRDPAGRSFARFQSQMLAWVRATLIMGALTGASTAILLHFIGLRPVFVFGVLSCFGEFVPSVGPILAAIPGLFVAAGMGPMKLLLAFCAYFFMQQIESNVLVPFIMGRQMELHPVTIVFFALTMGSLLGPPGAVFAVPAAALTKILIDEFYYKPNQVPLEAIEESAEKLVHEREWNGEQ